LGLTPPPPPFSTGLGTGYGGVKHFMLITENLVKEHNVFTYVPIVFVLEFTLLHFTPEISGT
jgi:hypothetical protein